MDTYFILDPKKCIGCGECAKVCDELEMVEHYRFNDSDPITYYPDYWWDVCRCHHCFGHGLPEDAEKPTPDCLKVCPTQAISYERW